MATPPLIYIYRSVRSLLGLVAALSLLAITGCTDNIDVASPSNVIRFRPKVVDGGWSAMSRSGNAAAPYESYTVDSIGTNPFRPGKPLYLHTKVEEGFVTSDPKVVPDSQLKSRGGNMVTGPDNFYDTFYASAYLFNYFWNENGTVPNYFENKPVQRGADGTYNLNDKIFWPGQQDQFLRFTAYAPKIDNYIYHFEGKDKPDYPAVAYIMRTPWEVDLDNQLDLLFANSDEDGYDCTTQPEVTLNFKHALAAVRFEVGGGMDGVTVHRVIMRDIWVNGVLNSVTGEIEAAWSGATVGVTVNKQISDNHLTDLFDGRVLLMPPTPSAELLQSMGLDHWHTLWLDVTVNGVRDEIEIPGFKKQLWEGGKTYTYRITNSNYVEVMDVIYGTQQASAGEVDVHTLHSGGSDQFQLVSKIDGVTPKPLAWKAYFQPEGTTGWSATPPTWLSLSMYNGPGSGPGTTEIRATTTPIVPVEVDLDASVRKSQNGSAAGRYDLTTRSVSNDVLGTTANCYVANRWGYYKFPLVYGNGWDKDKGVNVAAYHGPENTPKDELNVLSTFVDHLGYDIGSPFIVAHSTAKFTISHAALLWEDSPGLIANVHYDPTLYTSPSDPTKKIGGITFDIPYATAKQGNAVIALYDTAGRIVWSWHIWVTPMGAQYTVPYVSQAGYVYNIDAVNLGWVSFNPIKDYRARKCRVRFESETGNSQVEIMVAQQPHAILCPGDAMFYQWGRKDPFRGIDRSGAEVALTVERYKKEESEVASPKRPILAWRTQNPNVFHRMGLRTLTETERSVYKTLKGLTENCFVNLWDSQNKEQNTMSKYSSTKSIYDPCPPGFKVAPPDALTGVFKQGVAPDGNNPDTWYGMWDEGQKAWSAYSTKEHLVQSLFPTSGYRDFDNLAATYYRGEDSYIWTSGVQDHSGAIYFWIGHRPTQKFIYVYNYFLMGNGYNVRAVRDEAPESNRVSPRRRP